MTQTKESPVKSGGFSCGLTHTKESPEYPGRFTSENAVKTQVWIAISVYVLVAIITKNEDRSYQPPKIFSTAVNHPNGLVLTDDEKTLYVAQIFNTIRPLIRDDRLWAIEMRDGRAVSDARLVTRTGPRAANDGLAMDKLGRIYIAANFLAGEVWRFDPATGRVDLLAGGMYGAASIAFEEGEFDHQSIYVTTTFNGGRGGNIWRIPVGIKGAKLNR